MSICIMSSSIWKKHGYLELTSFTITLHAYDEYHYQPSRIYQNFPIKIKGIIFLIDIKFMYFPLDYDILLGCSYMYSMKAISYFVFQTMKLICKDKLSPLIHFNTTNWILLPIWIIFFPLSQSLQHSQHRCTFPSTFSRNLTLDTLSRVNLYLHHIFFKWSHHHKEFLFPFWNQNWPSTLVMCYFTRYGIAWISNNVISHLCYFLIENYYRYKNLFAFIWSKTQPFHTLTYVTILSDQPP